MSKWVGNSACVLVHVFNTASRQCHVVWACLGLFSLTEVAKPGHRIGSISLCKRGLCQSLVVPLWLRDLTWRVGLRLIQMARSLLVVISLPVLLMLGRRRAVRGQHSWCVTVHSILIILIFGFAGWYVLPYFGSMEVHCFQQFCASYGSGSPSSA